MTEPAPTRRDRTGRAVVRIGYALAALGVVDALAAAVALVLADPAR
ncbi:hypothetical protein [Dactylosporangium darangshiense]